MSSRAPRQLFAASLRASARSSKTNAYSNLHASRRAMSSTAEAVKKNSDMPWIIGSAVVFGPAFLYLVSPASRKSAPHHDSHGKHEKKRDHEPMSMKDDEGTEVDVSGSVEKAEADDVPKADSADKDKPEESGQAPLEKSKNVHESVPKDPAGAKDDSGPTEQGQVRSEAMQSESGPESPKGLDEKIDKAKDGESS
ncbi:hypothetical protein J3R30DRAFT_3699772 [Lentinula aciculospora]|uniref:Uncharacterized protein n=1 Tax=Lentinula aciculospora TaxID=153920 RepID=A0A9W9DR19_9AGAR|nr:hypothetical protein J3R30DRAFT_3699772 [Lentinula aciculospora]